MKFALVLLLFVTVGVYAQNTPPNDLENYRSEKDSVIYSRLKTRMNKSKMGGKLYGFVFRDVYNSNSKKVELNGLETNPFQVYEGKIITSVRIQQLEVLGGSVNDTTRKGSRIGEFLSKTLHTNTQEKVIRNSFLLFKEGDQVNPQRLKDNERLLRANPIIHDARILVLDSNPADNFVDIVVVVQDVWSLNIVAGFSSFNDFQLGIEEKNSRGMGNSFLNKVTWKKNDPYKSFGFRSIYTIPYIGNSFITGQVSVISEKDLTEFSGSLSRPFLTVETKNAGAFEVGYFKEREYKKLKINNIEKDYIYQVGYFYSDIWYGRAFKTNFGSKNQRLILAARRSSYNFMTRPDVSADSNKIYWDRKTVLGSIGYSTRNYRRDILIYGFGRTEDVPIGDLVSVTYGREQTEFGSRNYGGIQFAKGLYLPKYKGYVYSLVNFGTYFNGKKADQGTLNIQQSYFTPLTKLGKAQTRHFVDLGFTYGINRDDLDYLNISGKEGILGVNSSGLRGDKRLTLGIESVLFSRRSLVGFRIAYFTFANFGLVSLKGQSLFSSKLYNGFGLGMRIRNENLTINTFQVRIGFYPNIPDISSPWRFAFDGIRPYRLRDFDISAPTIIPLEQQQ